MPGSVTLHEEIAAILRASDTDWLTTKEIADEVNRRGNYQKRDRSEVTSLQVHGRTRNYSGLFERAGSRVRLRNRPMATPGAINPPSTPPHRPVTPPCWGDADPDARAVCDYLASPDSRLAADDWPGSMSRDSLRLPGLYSWWVDAEGAEQLSIGLGLRVSPGLIYAGQTGAGSSSATLRSRIGRNHLEGNIRGSTFRWTLAAILASVIGLRPAGHRKMDPRSEADLSAWMREHLSVAAVGLSDRSEVLALEAEVLAALDPPLNLSGMPSSEVRAKLTWLRKQLGRAT